MQIFHDHFEENRQMNKPDQNWRQTERHLGKCKAERQDAGVCFSRCWSDAIIPLCFYLE